MNELIKIGLILVLAATAKGDNLGAAYYGIQHPSWPCRRSLQILDRGPVNQRVSMFWGSFGPSETCLRRWLDKPGKKMLEIHLVNECCIRNGNCAHYEFGYGHTIKSYEAAVLKWGRGFDKRMRAWAKKPAQLVADFRGPDFTCLISPGLESNLSAAAMEKMIRKLKPQFPGCKFVSHAKHVKGAAFAEYHTRMAAPPCILSNDDGLYPPNDMSKWIETGRECRAMFLWRPEFNGWRGIGPQVDPRSRTNFRDKSAFDWLRANLW